MTKISEFWLFQTSSRSDIPAHSNHPHHGTITQIVFYPELHLPTIRRFESCERAVSKQTSCHSSLLFSWLYFLLSCHIFSQENGSPNTIVFGRQTFCALLPYFKLLSFSQNQVANRKPGVWGQITNSIQATAIQMKGHLQTGRPSFLLFSYYPQIIRLHKNPSVPTCESICF